MASKIEICNFALGLVSEAKITSLTENNEQSRACNLYLDQATREVLSAANWRSARERASLVMLAAKPAFGFHNKFRLPDNFLRVVQFNKRDVYDRGSRLFEIEGRNLLTNAAIAKILYIRDLTKVEGEFGFGLMDDLLAQAVYTNLAIKLAWPFQQSRTLRDSLVQEYQLILKAAKTRNATDALEPVEDDDWTTNAAGPDRRHGTGNHA